MSPSSIDKVLSGGDISENMLFRIEQVVRRSALLPSLSSNQRYEIHARPWRSTQSEKVQDLISSLTVSLTDLLSKVKTSNEIGNDKSAISELQKAQLIATLEAALAMLKAPAVNAQETGNVFRWLTRIFTRGAEKSLEKGVSDAFGTVIGEGAELIEELVNQPGLSDIDKLI